MYKMSAGNTPKTVKQDFYKLSSKDRIRLLEELEEEFFSTRFRQITSALHKKAKTTSLEKITQITKKIQKQLYGKQA